MIKLASYSIIFVILFSTPLIFAQSEESKPIIEIPYESLNPFFEPTQKALTAFLSDMGKGGVSFIAAVILMIGGTAVAYFAKRVSRFALKRLFSIKIFKENSGVEPDKIGDEKAEGITKLVNLFPDIFFWFVIAFFAILAIDALGFQEASEAIRTFWVYLPNIVGALFFVIAGFIFAKMAKKAIESSKSVYFGRDSGIIAPVEIIIYVVSFSLAVTQLKIGQEIITILLWTISGGVMTAVAIAVGWGLRYLPSSILSLSQLKKLGLDVGAEITFKHFFGEIQEEIKGTVVESTLTHTTLKASEKEFIIPNVWLYSNKVSIKRKEKSDK